MRKSRRELVESRENNIFTSSTKGKLPDHIANRFLIRILFSTNYMWSTLETFLASTFLTIGYSFSNTLLLHSAVAYVSREAAKGIAHQPSISGYNSRSLV